MRRKTPRSHTYTILSLAVLIVAVAGFLVYSQLPDEEKIVDETSAQIQSSTQLQVEEGGEASQAAPGFSGDILQSPASNLQTAGDVEMYESYDTHSSTQNDVQPQ